MEKSAQALNWKHNLSLQNIPRKIKEKLFSGEEYGIRLEKLKEIDEDLRQTALGDNKSGISLKRALEVAHNGLKSKKYIDAAYGASLVNDILQEVINKGQQAAYELANIPSEYFAGGEPESVEYFSQKQAALKDIYRSIFGDPLEKAYAKQFAAHKRVLDSLVRNADIAVAEVLSCFNKMGYAKAGGKFDVWVKEFDNIKKIHNRLNNKFLSTYRQSIKFFVDIAVKGKDEGAPISVQQVTQKLDITPEPEKLVPDSPIIESPKAEVTENKKESLPVELEDLPKKQKEELFQLQKLVSALNESKTGEDPSALIDTLDEWAYAGNGKIYDENSLVADLENGKIFFNIQDTEGNPLSINVWSLPKVLQQIPEEYLFSKSPVKDEKIVAKVEEIAPEAKEKRPRGRPPKSKNKPKESGPVVQESVVAPESAPKAISAPAIPEPIVVPEKAAEPIVAKPEPIVEPKPVEPKVEPIIVPEVEKNIQPNVQVHDITVPKEYSPEILDGMKPHEIGALINSIKNPDILAALSKYKNSTVRHGVVANDNAPASVIYNLTNDEDEGVKSLATQIIKDKDAIVELAASKDPKVRFWIFKNKNTKKVAPEISIALANDPEVRKLKNKEAADALRLGVKPEQLERIVDPKPIIDKVLAPPTEISDLAKKTPKELKALADNSETADDILAQIADISDDMFVQIRAINNIKSKLILQDLSKDDNSIIRETAMKRLKEMGESPAPYVAPAKEITKEPEVIETPTPVVEPVVEPEVKEEKSINDIFNLPKKSHQEKLEIENPILFIVMPEIMPKDEIVDKGKLQRRAVDFYKKEYPNLKQAVTYSPEKIEKLFNSENGEKYKTQALDIITYEDLMKKLDKKPKKAHEDFYNQLQKIAELNNPAMLATAMVIYSGEIEDFDQELSIKLLAKAQEILDV